MKAKRENVPSYCDREGQWPWGGGDLDPMDILDVSGVSKRCVEEENFFKLRFSLVKYRLPPT